MHSLDNVDETLVESCKRQFHRIYPEFNSRILGATNDRQALLVECFFPDGVFYFRVTESSVSSAYGDLRDADNGNWISSYRG